MRWTLWIVLIAACGVSSPPRRSPENSDRTEEARRVLRAGSNPSAPQCASLLGRIADPVVHGDVALACARHDEALASYQQAWRGGDRRCALGVAIALLLERAGDARSARRTLSELPVDRRCRDALLALARLSIGADDPQARTILAQLVRSNANDGEALALLALLHLQHAEIGAALGLCERTSELSSAAFFEACARVSWRAGEQHQAEERFRASLGARETLTAYLNLGEMLLVQRRDPEAIDVFRRALRFAPDSYEATIGFGRALRGAECYPEARTAFERAAAASPRRADAFFYLGHLEGPPCAFSTDEKIARQRALFRFLELAGDDPRYAEEREAVTRRCRYVRIRPGDGRYTCPPGMLQTMEEMCGGRLRDIQAAIVRQQRASDPRCALPW